MGPYELAEKLGALLKTRDEKIATAESCTGGGVAEAITAVAGSSAWFDMAIVSYSNDAKQRLLGVPPQLLIQFGAVSEQVVASMAGGILRLADSHWGVAVSGIAGPGGAAEGKPVGTVCFALAGVSLSAPIVQTMHFSGDREAVRTQAVNHALNMVLTQLGG